MGKTFKSIKAGMMAVLERYSRGSRAWGRNFVFCFCKCYRGKEFIASGDDLSKHSYPCGCAPKPTRSEGRPNDWVSDYNKEACALASNKGI